MRVRGFSLSVVLLVVGFCVLRDSVAESEKPAAEKQQGEEIRKLIKQLNAEDFKLREAAMRQLMEREDVLPALREAAKSEDAEIRRRAQKAMEAINKRVGKRAIHRAIAKLKKGQTDQFVDAVVSWREYVDDDCWKAAVEHVDAINDKAVKASDKQFKLARELPRRKPVLPWIDIAKLRVVKADQLRPPQAPFYEVGSIKKDRILAERISVEEAFIVSSFILCRGSVKIKNNLGYSVIFANGNVTAGDSKTLGAIGDCIIICDGNVSATAGVNDSVIVCTGKVSLGAAAKNSVIVSGGEVKMGLTFQGASPKNSLIQERQQGAFNFIQFFDPTRVGIEVKASRNKLRVEGIAAARAFGHAGIRVGDEVVALNGVKVDSGEAFSRLLRRSVQESKPILLDIEREGRPMRIKVLLLSDSP